MTYLPGGRINATISGNTSGAGALISTGTLTLAGGNNITLSQAGNAITISGGAGGGTQTLGMSNLGNTSGTTGVVSGSAIRYLFAGGNNITLSQSINGASGTVTFNAASQSLQTSNVHNVTLGGNTAGVMAQVSSGTLTLAGGNNIVLSQNGNAVTISASAQSAQTQSNIQAMYDGTNSISTGTVRLSNANGISFGIAGQNITASHNALTSQSVQTQGLQNVTLGGNTAGAMAAISSGTLNLIGGNNITLSQNGNTVTISGGAGGGGGGGVAIANSQTTYTSGTANFIEGGGAITISTAANQSLKFAVPAMSSLSATGAVSISTNGSTISIGAPITPNFVTLSRFEYPVAAFTSLQTQGQGSLSLQHVYIPFNVTATAMKIGGSLSGVTNTSITTASANVSLWMGIYTLNGSSLSLASSGSANNGFQWSQSNSSTGNTSINSMRQMTVPMNINLTPGEYWVGAVMSSATTYTNFSYWLYGNAGVNPSASAAILTPIGSNTSAGRDAFLFQGIYTANTSAGPTSISGAQINNTSVSNIIRAQYYFAMFNATY